MTNATTKTSNALSFVAQSWKILVSAVGAVLAENNNEMLPSMRKNDHIGMNYDAQDHFSLFVRCSRLVVMPVIRFLLVSIIDSIL